MPPKGSSKDPRYIGTDPRGYAMFTADCGHVVWGRAAERCIKCYARRRAAPNYIGVIDGKQMYVAVCGHPARRKEAKRCPKCVREHKAKGYSPNWYPTVPRKTGEKIVRVHTQIAERVLGRKLKPNEVVHHINMDKRDNRNCNLLICTREYHRSLHVRMEIATARRIRTWQDAQGA